MKLIVTQSIKDISLTDLDGKELRKIAKAIARLRDGTSDKRYLVKNGDKVHICRDIFSFIYDKYRNEPVYDLEYYTLDD